MAKFTVKDFYTKEELGTIDNEQMITRDADLQKAWDSLLETGVAYLDTQGATERKIQGESVLVDAIKIAKKPDFQNIGYFLNELRDMDYEIEKVEK